MSDETQDTTNVPAEAPAEVPAPPTIVEKLTNALDEQITYHQDKINEYQRIKSVFAYDYKLKDLVNSKTFIYNNPDFDWILREDIKPLGEY